MITMQDYVTLLMVLDLAKRDPKSVTYQELVSLGSPLVEKSEFVVRNKFDTN